MALSYTMDPMWDGSTWDQNGIFDGRHDRQVYVTGFASANYYSMVLELYTDAGRFNVGDQMDALFPLWKLTGWSIVQIACNQSSPYAILRLRYGQTYTITTINADADGPVTFRQRSIPLEIETQFDRSGALMKTVRNGENQVKTVVRPKSLLLLECERLEDANPEPRVRPLLDHVNSATWNGRAARTVLFADYSADTRDNGDTYQVFYSFVYRSDTHDPLLPHLLPIGLPPADLPTTPSAGTALIQPEVIPEASFASLNISIPT